MTLDGLSHIFRCVISVRGCVRLSVRMSVRQQFRKTAENGDSGRETIVVGYWFISDGLFRCAVASLYEVVSVRPSVRRSVGPSVRPVLFSKVISMHTRRILCRVSGLVVM